MNRKTRVDTAARRGRDEYRSACYLREVRGLTVLKTVPHGDVWPALLPAFSPAAGMRLVHVVVQRPSTSMRAHLAGLARHLPPTATLEVHFWVADPTGEPDEEPEIWGFTGGTGELARHRRPIERAEEVKT